MTGHFLVIGAQRCGTTWLARALESQPGIAMARPVRPEPKVFLEDLTPDHDLAWYDATWFGHAEPGQVLGEKSTSYLDRPDAIPRIDALLGACPLVVQLRDPVARAVSHWRFSTQHGLEERPLAEALGANLEGPLPWDAGRSSVSPYAYLERGRYAAALRPWLDACGERVHVQVLEELLADPRQLSETLRHVGVAGDPGDVPLEAVNASEAPRTPLEPALEQDLRAYFAESDTELENLLGRPLPWAPRSDTDHREDAAR